MYTIKTNNKGESWKDEPLHFGFNQAYRIDDLRADQIPGIFAGAESNEVLGRSVVMFGDTPTTGPFEYGFVYKDAEGEPVVAFLVPYRNNALMRPTVLFNESLD